MSDHVSWFSKLQIFPFGWMDSKERWPLVCCTRNFDGSCVLPHKGGTWLYTASMLACPAGRASPAEALVGP